MDLFHYDFSFFRIQNHETKYMDFVHKRFSVAGGLRRLDPPSEFAQFFFIFQKNKLLFEKIAVWSKSLLFWSKNMIC